MPENHTVPFKSLYPLSLKTQPLRNAKTKFVEMTEGSSNGRKASIYKPKGGLNNLRPPRWVANLGGHDQCQMPA